MAVNIRNLSSFGAPVGELSIQALDLIGQGRAALSGLVTNLASRFVLDPAASSASTLRFTETGGADLLQLDGRFSASTGRVSAMTYSDDVVTAAGEPVSGERYLLTGGSASYNATTGFSGYFTRVHFDDYTEAYSATLSGKFFIASGIGSFNTAQFQAEYGLSYRFRGDIRLNVTDGPAFSGTLRSLDISNEAGQVIATARGLRIDAADFGEGAASFAGARIFSGNDNVTLGNSGVNFKAWDGNDRVVGGAWIDTIDGGNGRDVLTGGFGGDFFRFSADAVVTTSYEADQITDFYVEVDTLVFDTNVFVALADSRYRGPVTAALRYDLAQADGVLTCIRGLVQYDADGSAGPGAAVSIVKLAGNPDPGNSNFAAESFTGL